MSSECPLRPEHYGGPAAEAWERGATLVYRPLATALVGRATSRLEGTTVLDVGAGTGVTTSELRSRGARPVALDFSLDMLRTPTYGSTPRAVADVRGLPVRDDAAEVTIAAFVLNHLADPVRGLAELRRVTRPGGTVLADVFSNSSQHDARDAVDRAAASAGWVVPDWYAEMKRTVVPLLGTAASMADAAREAGLASVHTEEQAVDVGLHDPTQLVAYRFGQAPFAPFVAGLLPTERERLLGDATAAAAECMTPYRPTVVFLEATVPVDGAPAAPAG